ncbi:MAG: hypothetical protein H7257_05875 [Taibaiella sp.]|nr:hypothetical protein [Taibaiella sp.]
MKTCKGVLKLVTVAAAMAATALTATGQEKYGKTLNLGIGVGYFNYIGRPVPFFSANYEFDVARQFTLAPFVGFASYRSNNYWKNNGQNNRYYYHESVVPLGVKGTYYFDRILGANANWDFYLAASAGIAIHNVTWDDGYYGDKDVYRGRSPLYLDLHIGTEYHFAKRAGIFADLSTGVSTVGLAIHGR